METDERPPPSAVERAILCLQARGRELTEAREHERRLKARLLDATSARTTAERVYHDTRAALETLVLAADGIDTTLGFRADVNSSGAGTKKPPPMPLPSTGIRGG